MDHTNEKCHFFIITLALGVSRESATFFLIGVKVAVVKQKENNEV